MFIYIIKNTVNGKRYVGQTVDVTRRFLNHFKSANNPKCANYKCSFYEAIRKYGKENFIIDEIIDYGDVTLDQMYKYEEYYIHKYRTCLSFPDCQGYNHTFGGEGGNQDCGFETDVYDLDLNLITTCRSMEEAARQFDCFATNVRANIIGRLKTCNGYIFCRHGETPKKPTYSNVRAVDIYDLDLNFVKQVNSLREAADFIGCNIVLVFNCCNQIILKCKNYITVYAGEDVHTRRRDNSRKLHLDVYDLKYNLLYSDVSMVFIHKTLKIGKAIIQRCSRTNNHLAGDYIIVPHTLNQDDDIV